MKEGDVFRAEMPGSGGFGDPFLRDPEAVRRDVLQGKVTPAHARAAYGVAVTDKGVNVAETAKLREGHI